MRHSTASWWKMSLCFLGILEHTQGLALFLWWFLTASLPPCPSFLSGNPAHLRVTQAFAGRTLTADKLPPFCNFFPFPRPFHIKFTVGPKKPHVLQKCIVCVFYSLALTEGLCSSKPPEGYCMGDLVLFRLWNIPFPDLSIFWGNATIFRKERIFFYWRTKSYLLCKFERANFSSQISMTDCILGWEQLRHMGTGMGSWFPCSVPVTLQGWC